MYTYNWQGISLLLPPNKACPLEKKKKKRKADTVGQIFLYIMAKQLKL